MPRTLVMGILNVTPDSFSDGGRFASLDAAVDRARGMVEEGADVIDVGGESTRPGAEEIPVDEEIGRTAPVIEAIANLGMPISIDTRKAAVAKAALDAGATMVNDVSAGAFDAGMLPLVADRAAEMVLMHMRGTPQTMDSLASYDDVAAEVLAELSERVAGAEAAGIDRTKLWIDPGLGFAKTPEQSLELLRRVDELRAPGLPLVIGPSRKRFIGNVLDVPVDDRLEGTAAAVAWCAFKGVEMVRVHDVKAMRRVVDMAAAIQNA
jgi:dihydropteroate synthase